MSGLTMGADFGVVAVRFAAAGLGLTAVVLALAGEASGLLSRSSATSGLAVILFFCRAGDFNAEALTGASGGTPLRLVALRGTGIPNLAGSVRGVAGSLA